MAKPILLWPPGSRAVLRLAAGFLIVIGACQDGWATGRITRVQANASSIILAGESTPGFLRIVELEPNARRSSHTNAPIVARLSLRDSALQESFRITLPRFDGKRDRLYSGFLLLNLSNTGQPVPFGEVRYVNEFMGVSKYAEPFPLAPSKKGLQVQMVEDAIELGVKHAALNFNLAAMVDTGNRSNALTWSMDGQTFQFRPEYLQAIDQQVKALTEAGAQVTLILLNYRSGDAKLDAVMLHPHYDPSAPNHLSAFNLVTHDGLQQFKACIEFIADRYSRTDRQFGRVLNFVVGNEVNSHWFWYNLGRARMETVVHDYVRTVRVCNTAVRKFAANARVYLSLEHHWNIRYPGGDDQQAFPGHAFLEHFGRRARAGGDFDWHLAFHPYPENLFEPRTWNDKSATKEDQTPRITFKNLEVLTEYMQRLELLHDNKPRRIILSEQGFHTPDTADGEQIQAAAYCYAYQKVARLPGIDSFILHRHVDHRAEGGLKLGLWRRNELVDEASRPGSKKMIYRVFRQADTPDWKEAFDFALPIIGISRWEDLR